MAQLNLNSVPSEFTWTLQWKNWLNNLWEKLTAFVASPEFPTVTTDELQVNGNVFVDGSVEIEEDISAQDAAFSGELTVGEDVSVGEDLIVGGQIMYGAKNLTGLGFDYALVPGEAAVINITGASTLLNIAVTDGLYELDLIFDDTTFGADQAISLNANNTTYAGEFKRIRLAGDTAIATDEVDTSTSDEAAHSLATASRPRHAHAKLIISGLISNLMTELSGVNGGSRRIELTSSNWVGSVAHTSLGTLSIGEAATGTIYVKRIA